MSWPTCSESVVSREDIEKEKGVILEELKMEVDNPEYLLHEIFSSNFYKDHPIGKPILGTKDTVKKFDREMIHHYYRRYYSPKNILITAAGNLKHERLVELTRQHLRICACTARFPGPPPVPTPVWCFAIRPLSNKPYVHGRAGLSASDQLRFACYALNTLLGGGMSSRSSNIREKLGLAYAVYSELSMYRDTGCMASMREHPRNRQPR